MAALPAMRDIEQELDGPRQTGARRQLASRLKRKAADEEKARKRLVVHLGEVKLQEAGFMYNAEKSVWYHQGTEFGRRKAENEEKSVEKLVSYLEVRNPDKIQFY